MTRDLVYFDPENTLIQAETSKITLYKFANTPFPTQQESFSNHILPLITYTSFNLPSWYAVTEGFPRAVRGQHSWNVLFTLISQLRHQSQALQSWVPALCPEHSAVQSPSPAPDSAAASSSLSHSPGFGFHTHGGGGAHGLLGHGVLKDWC